MSSNCTTASTNVHSAVIQVSFLSFLFIICIMLNVKTFIVIMKQTRELRKAVTIFLLNLTLVSGLMALLLIPFNIFTIIENRWIFGPVFCKVNGFTNVFLCSDLVFTLLCMTIDRYFSVMKPLKHRVFMTRRIAFQMLIATFVLSFLLALIPVLGVTSYEYHPGTNHCSPAWYKSCPYYFLVFSIGFVTPILGMLITYTRIILKVRSNRSKTGQWPSSLKESKQVSSSVIRARPAVVDTSMSAANHTLQVVNDADEITSNVDNNDELPNTSRSARRRSMFNSVMRHIRNRMPQEYKIARAGLILVLTYAMLWTPYLAAHSCLATECSSLTFYTVSMFLVYLNAIAHPVIYALTNRTVIRDLKSHFRRIWCR